jgi:hypothetical protein
MAQRDRSRHTPAVARLRQPDTVDEDRRRAHLHRGLDAVPAIRRYITSVPVTAAYWEVEADSPDEAVSAASELHPVFRLAPVGMR